MSEARHDINVIINGIADLQGAGDSSGSLQAMKDSAVELNTRISAPHNNMPPMQVIAAHDLLHEIQEWIEAAVTDVTAKNAAFAQFN